MTMIQMLLVIACLPAVVAIVALWSVFSEMRRERPKHYRVRL